MKHQGELTLEEEGEWKGKEVRYYGCKICFTGNADYRKSILGPLTIKSSQKKQLLRNKKEI